MAVILNIESSTEVCSVTLSENGNLLSSKENTEGLNHSKLLSVFIDEIFQENNLGFDVLNAIAISKGPGSYTGLRIGVSVAKGLCYALNIPLIAISTLDAMGIFTSQNPEQFLRTKNEDNLLFCPMIDARRMEVYTALYNLNGETVKAISAEIITENSFSQFLANHKIMFFGNGAEKCRQHIKHPNALFFGPSKASARFMQKLTLEKYHKNELEDLAYFEPFYLKDFVATIPKNKIFQ